VDFSEAISQKRCKIGVKLLLITNRKLYMGIRLAPKSVTLNNPERRNSANGRVISPHSVDFRADYLKCLKIHQYFLQRKCKPKNLVFVDISFMAILAGDHPQRER